MTKTDTLDTSTLADLLRANLVAESYITPKHIGRLREITRERRGNSKGFRNVLRKDKRRIR